MDKTGSSNNKVLEKRDMSPEGSSAFELQQEPPNWPHSALYDFYLFPKLKSHLPCCHFWKNPCCSGVLGGQGCKHLAWGNCNAWTWLDQVYWCYGGLYQNIVKSCLDCATPWLGLELSELPSYQSLKNSWGWKHEDKQILLLVPNSNCCFQRPSIQTMQYFILL